MKFTVLFLLLIGFYSSMHNYQSSAPLVGTTAPQPAFVMDKLRGYADGRVDSWIRSHSLSVHNKPPVIEEVTSTGRRRKSLYYTESSMSKPTNVFRTPLVGAAAPQPSFVMDRLRGYTDGRDDNSSSRIRSHSLSVHNKPPVIEEVTSTRRRRKSLCYIGSSMSKPTNVLNASGGKFQYGGISVFIFLFH